MGVSRRATAITATPGAARSASPPKTRCFARRLDPDEAAERVYNFLHTLTIECADDGARLRQDEHLHSLEPEDLAALTMEASAMAGVPLAGTDHTVGVDPTTTTSESGQPGPTLGRRSDGVMPTIDRSFNGYRMQ